MDIAVIGATGMVGSRVVAEAYSRGHSLTAIGRQRTSLSSFSDQAQVRSADVFDSASVAEAARGADLAVVAIRLASPRGGGEPASSADHVAAVNSLLAGLESASVPRLIVVGGAGSLKVPPGVRLVDSPEFPERFRANALAQAAGLAVLQSAEPPPVWSCICPPMSLAPGQRTGRYEATDDFLLRGEDGLSAISAEDFAVAIIDEAERPQHEQRLFCVASLADSAGPRDDTGMRRVDS
jgi:uncharacterized protein